MAGGSSRPRKFYVEIIKPSHYDDEGYVIQWVRAFVPSNSLACLYALAKDVAQRRALGDVEVVVNAYDESHTVIPTPKIIRRMQAAGASGMVLLAGVQTNQFPRAIELARQFRAAGIAVAVGGFHVSGCLAMLPELTDELKTMESLGVALFAGEAEGRMESLLADAYHGRLQPRYNYLGDLPNLQGQAAPFLPDDIARKNFFFAPFDAGRGCPFQCSFCTIINVQGRKSRWRDADDVERLVRTNWARGIRRFFITDDNMARNKNWEAIFDRLIAMRQNEGVRIKFIMQVDTMSHRIPNFVDKATRAGCTRIFIGLESVNPANLAAAKKGQNHVGEYRKMLMTWRSRHVMIYAGYILGFPGDTPESIERDIRTIQRELPIDILEFFLLTPLPGSADHKAMHQQGVWMEPDLNCYDLEHVTTAHPSMSAKQWRAVYDRAWHLYYSDQHVRTMLRRAKVGGAGMKHLLGAILAYYGSYRFEHVHPLQGGILRLRLPGTRRPGSPKEDPLLFYPRQIWKTLSAWLRLGRYYLFLDRLRRQVDRDPTSAAYSDAAIAGDFPDSAAASGEASVADAADGAQSRLRVDAKEDPLRDPEATPAEKTAASHEAA